MAELEEKTWVLDALNLLLADPVEIRMNALETRRRFAEAYRRPEDDAMVRKLAAERVVAQRSNRAAFVGAASALVGIVPGLGTVLAVIGGATADAALSMKYQIEMVMEIATIYDHDIREEEARYVCLVVAGLGATSEAAKVGAKHLAARAAVNMTRAVLKGATLQAVKTLLRRVGISFTRKALEKAIPFGIGVLIGATVNKLLTRHVGRRAIATYTVL